jgi:coenzyme F420 hydrogenase subunit delta
MEFYPSYCLKRNLVLGCGNILFGDDGFGPEFIDYVLSKYNLPEDTLLVNAGISVREILFNISLSEKKPEKIIIIDAIDTGEKPGEIFEIDIDEIPKIKIDDFSMHQLPTSNLLKELKEKCNVDVRVLSVQVENVPQEVNPGLSDVLKSSMDKMYKELLKILEE